MRVEENGVELASYGYDSQNRRIRKTANGRTVYYHYDLDNQLLAETLADGTPLREYVYLDGEPLAVRVHDINPGMYFYVNDHLGTPQQLVNLSREVVWKAAYLPFGAAQVRVGAITNNLRFPGQYYDAETGLHYNWNRYYNPATGRYISPDPIGLYGGLNLYAYVGNNPVNWSDPEGLWSIVGGFGGQANFHAFIAGISGSFVPIAGFGTENQGCVARTFCVRIGPGIYGGAGGVLQGGLSTGKLEDIGGWSFGIGGDFGVGPSSGGGQITVGKKSLVAAKGRYGGGAGISGGIDICKTKVDCPGTKNCDE